jgi:Icc-related predicted phosphoesterase
MNEGKLTIVALSDQHGELPDVPPCDLLLVAGDVCPVTNHGVDFQEQWLRADFRRWLEQIPARKIVFIAGNHDFVFERRRNFLPGDYPATYLQDSGCEWEGLRIWGTPWQPPFFDWAFNLREEELARKWALIPDGTDILVCHGPPHGYGDGVPECGGVRHTGSPSLLERIHEVRPRLVVFGHIHEGRGEWRLGNMVLANVTLLDARYRPVHSPWVHHLEGR